jgi:CubicO group peptidase (beta-lactamase class C family)
MVLLHGILVLTDKTFLYKAIWYNYVNIDDLKLFENRAIDNATGPPWALASSLNQLPASPFTDSIHKALRTVAFLVIKNDTIIHEQYYEGYGTTSLSNSFSMAKSVVGMLVGVALTEGKIRSLDQPVGDFLPSFAEGDKASITIKHVLCMSSGLNWDESYSSPLSLTTEAYYGTDLPKLILNLKPIAKPGQKFVYLSGDTQLLALVLEKATGRKVADYLSEKIWKPIGAEHPAYWSLDHTDGTEKAYCCIYSNARDFARLGKLYLDSGNWNGRQIIDKTYVVVSTSPHLLADEDGKPVDYYGYQWWVIPDYKGRKLFYARGILGQYIFVSPADKLIAVRLGHIRGKEKTGKHPSEIYWYLDEAFRQAGLM